MAGVVNDLVIEVPLQQTEDNPWQTRPIDPNHRNGLAADIRDNGLYQYPVGRVVDVESGAVIRVETVHRLHECGDLFGGRYHLQIGIGHHRKAAYQQLADEDDRFSTFPVKIRYLTDEEMADIAMRENDERKNLSVIERARALQKRKESFGWTNTELGQRYGLARTTISNLLRLVRDLPPEAQEVVHEHDISFRSVQVLARAYSLPFVDGDQMLKAAISGASSIKLRGKLKYAIKQHTAPFGALSFPLDRDFVDGDVPACTNCSKAFSFGSRSAKQQRCPDRSCREYKRSTWRRQQLEEAAREANLPVAPQDTRPGERTRLGQADVAAILEAGGCEYGNLSLCRQNGGVVCGPDVERWPQVGYCCYHGYGGTCLCLRATTQRRQPKSTRTSKSPPSTTANGTEGTTPKRNSTATQTPKSPPSTEAPEGEGDSLERIIELAAGVLAQELATLNPRVLAELHSGLDPRRSLKSGRRQASEVGISSRDEILRAIARRLISHELPYGATPVDARRTIAGLFERVGVTPPWKSQEVPMN